MNINQEQFERAVARGFSIYTELKEDFPELFLRPVLSRFGSGSGQCDLTSQPLSVVRSFPEMMVDTSTAMRLAKLFREHKDAKKLKIPIAPAELKEVQHLKKCILKTKQPLYNGDVNIEFRPGILNYELLHRLQQDPRLPPGLNTVGNIRVIGGSLEMLAEIRV